MDYLPVLLAIVAVVIAIYYYVTKRINFFKNHGIPFIKPIPVLGSMTPLALQQCTIIEFLEKIYYQYPTAKYIGMFEFMNPIILLRDPDLIKSVTVKHFEHFTDHRPFFDVELDPLLGNLLFALTGEKWRDVRSLLSPTFTSSKIKSMFHLMTDTAVYFSEHLSKLSGNQQEVELKAELCKYTNDVIASCAFGIEVDTIKDPKNEMYMNGREATNFTDKMKVFKMFLQRCSPQLAKLFGLRIITKDSTKFFEDIIVSTMKSRQNGEVYRPDMIQLLVESRNKREGKGLSEIEIMANAFGFFFGGFDTVAGQTSFVVYLMAIYPEVQKKLQEEIDEAFEKTQGNLTYDVVQGLEYLDAVINETMRLYPLATFLDRVCVKSFELPPPVPGGKPFVVTPGMNLWVPVVAIQRNPDYFKDPERFDPERFMNDGKRIANSGTFIPFGLGPRMCIGNRFGLAKMKIVVSHVLARCDVKCCSKSTNPVELTKGMFNLAVKNGFWVKLEPRKNANQYVHAPVSNDKSALSKDE